MFNPIRNLYNENGVSYQIWEFVHIFAETKHSPSMKITFKDSALEELYETGKTKDRKYKRLCRSKKLVDGYIRAVSVMYRTEKARDLSQYSFLHYERLAHDPRSSVRIVNGRVERLLFTELEDGVEVELIEINDTHYGDKR